MTAIEKQAHPTRSTFAHQFGVASLTSSVRGITATLIAAVPKVLSVASLRADVMAGKVKMVEHAMKLMLAAIDAGKSADEVTQWLRDAEALVRAYAARRERRQGSGVLPFTALHDRVAAHETRQDCEADIARMAVNPEDLASLETARRERMEAIEAAEREYELLTNQIAALRARA